MDPSEARAPTPISASPERTTPKRARRGPRHPRATLALALAFVSPGCSEQPPAEPQVSEAKLRAELLPVVRDELRHELRPVVMEELRRELTQPSGGGVRPAASANPGSGVGANTRPTNPTPPASTPSAANTPNATGPGTPTTPGDLNPIDPQSDLWNRPGTTIWPSPGGLRLVELSVGTGLEEKLPVGIASHYQQVPEILFCYTVFENPGPDQTVTHVWRRSGRLVSRVELEVGKSPKWRTWSKQRVAPHWRGVWSCEVLSPEGTQLGLHVFQVGG